MLLGQALAYNGVAVSCKLITKFLNCLLRYAAIGCEYAIVLKTFLKIRKIKTR